MHAASRGNMIDTRKVQTRRTLRFGTLDDLSAEVDRLAEADRAGRLTALGNWTLGQAFGHLSTWINYCYNGFPFKTPLVLRLVLKPFKRRFLYKPMPAGVRLPKVAGGTYATEPLSLDEGLARYRGSIERLRREAPTQPSMAFGKMTHDEWIAMQLRHAENHMSFFKPTS